MKKNKLWLRILITVIWAGIASAVIFGIFIPNTPVRYSGNIYLTDSQSYEAFKKSLADSRYSINELTVVNDGSYLVSFDIQVPKETFLDYGIRNEWSTTGVVVISCLLYCLFGFGAFLSAWIW